MAQTVETLTVQLEASIAKYEKAMDRALGVTRQRTAQIEKRVAETSANVSSALGYAVGGGLSTILAGLSLGAVIGELRQVAEQFAGIADVADRTGLGAERIQELRYAADMAGGSAADLDAGLLRFSKGVSEAATGSGELEKVLRANGVALKDTHGNLRPLDDLLNDYANLVANAKNPQDALNLAMIAFGKSAGPGLVVALQNGAKGLRTAGEEARKFGVIVDKDVIRKAAELDDMFVRFSRVIKAQVGTALIEGADSIRTYQNAIIGLGVAIGAVTAGAALGPLAAGLSAAAMGAVTAAGRMNALNTAILAVAAAQRVAALASAGLSAALSLLGGPWGIAIAGLAAAIAYMALRQDDAKKSADDHKAALSALDAAIGQVKGNVPGAREALKALGDQHIDNARKALADAEAELEYARTIAASPARGAARPAMGGYAGRYNVQVPPDNSGDVAAAVEANVRRVAEAQARIKELQDKVNAGMSGGGSGNPTDVPNANADAQAKQWARVLEQSNQRISSLRLETEMVGKSTYETEKARVAQELLNAAKEAELQITPQLTAEVERRAAAQAEATVALEQARTAQASWNDLQQQWGDFAVSNISSVVAGYQSWNDVLKNGLGLITQMVLQAALLGQGPLGGMFGSAASGGGAGGLVGALFSGFKGMFADGGTLGAGQWGIAGEAGPEIVTGPARIVPTALLAAATPVAQAGRMSSVYAPQFTIDARGSQMTEAQFRTIAAQVTAAGLSSYDRRLAGRIAEVNQRGA